MVTVELINFSPLNELIKAIDLDEEFPFCVPDRGFVVLLQ